jgi:shikimate dehydrogenase
MCVSLSARPSTIGTRFHNYLYDALELDFVYKAFAPSNLEHAIAGMRGLPIRGAGISMPFKESVIELIDSLDESAATIHSVNTVVNTDGHLRGYNTDMQAVAQLLSGNGVTSQMRVAVVGTGGMAKACTAAVKSIGVTDGFVVGRNKERAEELAQAYGYARSNEYGEFDVIINATPIGMAGGADEHQLPMAPLSIKGAQLIVDCVAVPSVTPLIRTAVGYDIPTVRGTDIMTLQAVEQFVLYTGVRPSDELIALAAAFSRQE